MPRRSFTKRLLNWLRDWPTETFYLVKKILPFHASAWKATSEPIEMMLNANDVAERDRLTLLWRDSTQSQLSIICITSALMAAMITSAFTWPALAEVSASNLALVHMFWYCALLFAVVAIAAATQQAIALSRVCSWPNGLERLRMLLGHQKGLQWVPRRLQLFIWQTPIALLNASIYAFVFGLAILVWALEITKWPVPDCRVIVLFSLALTYAVGMYIVTVIGLYHGIANTPTNRVSGATSETVQKKPYRSPLVLANAIIDREPKRMIPQSMDEFADFSLLQTLADKSQRDRVEYMKRFLGYQNVTPQSS